MRIPRDFMEVLREVFDEFGVERWSIDRSRKHPMLTFTLAGKEFKYFIPSTPSDHRSSRNCRADLRRMCRLQRQGGRCRVSG